MKIFSVIALGAVLTLASCAKSEFANAEREPSPEPTGPVAYFTGAEANSKAKIDLGTEDTGFAFHVYRPAKAAEALDVSLSLTGDNPELFDVPAKVTIPANDSVAVVTIGVDVATLEPGKYYNLKLALTDNITPYGLSEITFAVGLIPWGEVGIAKYTPGFSNALYGLPEKSVYTKYQKADGLELYRLINPFLPAYVDEESGYPMGFTAIWEEEVLPGDHYIVIDATDPKRVVLEAQEIGISWPDDGAFIIAGAGVVLTGDDKKYGTKKGNTISIPTVYQMPVYDPGGWWALFTETIILDGPFDPDGDEDKAWEPAGSGYYSSGFLTETTGKPVSSIMNVEYSPHYLDGVGDVRVVNAYPSLDAMNAYKGNDYSISFQVDLETLEPIEGSVEERAIGLYRKVEGEDEEGKPVITNYPVYIENASITREGLYTYTITADFYMLDMVTGEKYEDIGTFTDTFFWNDQPEGFVIEWESLGTATLIDGLFPSLYLGEDDEYVAADWTWEVEIEQANAPNVYRIVNPYDAMGEAGKADVLYDEYYIAIDAYNPEKVFIDFQSAGIDAGWGETAIGSAILWGASDVLGTLKDGVIDFGDMIFQDDDGAYFVNYTMSLTLPEAEGEPAAAAYRNPAGRSFDQQKVAMLRDRFTKAIAKETKQAPPARAAAAPAKGAVKQALPIR